MTEVVKRYKLWLKIKTDTIISRTIMQNISTKTGDKGKSSLASGQRLSKANVRFEVIGDIDELNAWLGVIVVHLNDEFSSQANFLQMLQNQLFTFGAEVAEAEKVKLDQKVLDLIEDHSEKLQKSMEEGWHSRFLLPGGVEAAAWIDVARTVCRRTERHLVLLDEQEEIRPLLLKVINRLSDYLYVLRCYVNHELEYQEKEYKRRSQ
jgi:cob(I)alamin adenosyltransferase